MYCRCLLAVFRCNTPLLCASILARNTKSEGGERDACRAHATIDKRDGAAHTVSNRGCTLAEFHPGIARSWVVATSSKLLQPNYVMPNSRKLAWWRCLSCDHQFTKRIDLHVAAGGACPKCRTKPPVAPDASNESKTKKLRHRCRPGNSPAVLDVGNENRIKKSISDNEYLGTKELRNLMPMLAKNYEKEAAKIAPDELIYVSPKLDGIRCIAAYDPAEREVLFFSRSGTLFECCDAKIAPALRYAFESDPQLVLDGELYNDSANLAKASLLFSRGKAKACADVIKLFTGDLLNGSENLKDGKINAGTRHAKVASGTIQFEKLTSAIRTMRDHRTPQVAALQEKLQYHVFDVLYAGKFSAPVKNRRGIMGTSNSPCFALRFEFLLRILRQTQEHNTKTIADYHRHVLRLVPILPCLKSEVDHLLRVVMQLGYEGVMVRRDSLSGEHLTISDDEADGVKPFGQLTLDAVERRIGRIAGSFLEQRQKHSKKRCLSGGYAYGQRSGTLLKYKLMQDDEFIIVSAVEGKGKWRGGLGAFVCETKDCKRTFTVTPASTDAQKKAMWRHWTTDCKGKALTVQYQELTSDGIPRFPVGRCIRGRADGKDWI